MLFCGRRGSLAEVEAEISVLFCGGRGSLEAGVEAAGGAGVEAGFWAGGIGGLAISVYGWVQAPAGAACGWVLRKGVALPPVAKWW